MPLTRTQKKDIVTQVNATLKDAQSLILVHNKGMTVAQVSELRRRMREAGGSYRVVKNRLAKLAVKDTAFEEAALPMLKGPTALATSADPVSAAKVVVEFAKTNEKLVIIGGSFSGKALDVKGVEQLAKMPSLDQLRGMLVGMLQTPAQRLAVLCQANAAGLARCINAKAQKG